LKKQLLFTLGSLALATPIYSWLLYKAMYGFEFTHSDMWASLIVPLYVIGWTSSESQGFSAYDFFLLGAAICTALDIFLNAHPSILLLTATMIGTLILPSQYLIRTAKKQE